MTQPDRLLSLEPEPVFTILGLVTVQVDKSWFCCRFVFVELKRVQIRIL